MNLAAADGIDRSIHWAGPLSARQNKVPTPLKEAGGYVAPHGFACMNG